MQIASKIIIGLFATISGVASSALPADSADEDRRSFYFYTGLKLNSDSFDAGLSDSSEFLSLTFELTNQTPFRWLTEDKNYFSGELIINHEPDAQQFDSKRNKRSHEYSMNYQRPLKQTQSDIFISFLADYEYSENVQQTEEFERTLYAGLMLDKFSGWSNNVTNWGGIGALACNEEEKDDEIPRNLFGIERDLLNREGCGYFVQLHADTITSSGLIWSVTVDHYKGDYGTQYYRRQRFEAAVRWDLAKNNNCDVSYRVIKRKSERDFIGMDDIFYQFSFGCSHLF